MYLEWVESESAFRKSHTQPLTIYKYGWFGVDRRLAAATHTRTEQNKIDETKMKRAASRIPLREVSDPTSDTSTFSSDAFKLQSSHLHCIRHWTDIQTADRLGSLSVERWESVAGRILVVLEVRNKLLLLVAIICEGLLSSNVCEANLAIFSLWLLVPSLCRIKTRSCRCINPSIINPRSNVAKVWLSSGINDADIFSVMEDVYPYRSLIR